MKFFKILFQLFLFVFPWSIRRYLLKVILSFDLDKTSRIGMSIILAENVKMKSGTIIKHATFINAIDSLFMDEFSKIGSYNWITGASTSTMAYRFSPDRKCEFSLGKHVRITDRHYFDCNGGIKIGEFTTIAGLRSQFISHGINITENRQEAERIVIGKYCLVGSSVMVLKGAELPDYSVLGASSVLNKPRTIQYAVYAGSPAVLVKNLSDQAKYFSRKEGIVK